MRSLSVPAPAIFGLPATGPGMTKEATTGCPGHGWSPPSACSGPPATGDGAPVSTRGIPATGVRTSDSMEALTTATVTAAPDFSAAHGRVQTLPDTTLSLVPAPLQSPPSAPIT